VKATAGSGILDFVFEDFVYDMECDTVKDLCMLISDGRARRGEVVAPFTGR
jgi:hypothetical protein